jgi:hypothetical protein
MGKRGGGRKSGRNQSAGSRKNGVSSKRNNSAGFEVTEPGTCVWDSLLEGLLQCSSRPASSPGGAAEGVADGAAHSASSNSSSLETLRRQATSGAPLTNGVARGTLLLRHLRRKMDLVGTGGANSKGGTRRNVAADRDSNDPSDSNDPVPKAVSAEQDYVDGKEEVEGSARETINDGRDRARRLVAQVSWRGSGMEHSVQERTLPDGQFSAREVEDTVEALACTTANPNGYFCSACDPVLICVCAVFRVNIHNMFQNRLMVYEIDGASHEMHLISRGGHMQLGSVVRLVS